MTGEHLRKMFEMARTVKEKLLMQFLYSTGLRVMEVVTLRKKDLLLPLNKGIVRKGKGKK